MINYPRKQQESPLFDVGHGWTCRRRRPDNFGQRWVVLRRPFCSRWCLIPVNNADPNLRLSLGWLVIMVGVLSWTVSGGL